MVVLHLPSSIKLQTNIPPVSCRVCSLFATSNATYQTKQLHNNRPKQISLITRPNKLVRDRVLFKEYGKTFEEELQNGIDTILQRLKVAVETIIDSEVQKFTSRVDEELTFEDRKMLMEEMSREIVAKFWEKPVQYLESGDGNLEQKLKHVNFLVGALEQSSSCPNTNSKKKWCPNSQR